jgi:hypothetical protein
LSDQTPSLGRIVRYTDVDGTIVPAMIAGVHPDGSADLHVFHPTHGRVPPKSDDSITGNTWEWPPYVPPQSEKIGAAPAEPVAASEQRPPESQQ